MPPAETRLRRTVLNWKWWLVLPLWPFMAAIALMAMALETAADECCRLINWTRR